MNTKLIMISSAVVLGVTGIALSFLPQEISILLQAHVTGTLNVLLQILGALYFSFAMINWMAKDSPLGGIYGRPIVVGNMSHFVIGALALLKIITVHQNTVLLIVTAFYSIFALLFILLFYIDPSKNRSAA